MRIKHTRGAARIVHEDAEYTPDESGYFRIPFDLAETLLQQDHWEAEPAEVYVAPEEPEEELTPAQKGARTRSLKAEAAKSN